MSDSLLTSLPSAAPLSLSVGWPVRCRLRRVWPAAALLGAGLLPGLSQAQVLDDSTKVRYGAHTTFILKERDLLREDTLGQVIDTTLTRLPQQRYWAHDTTFQQDLGNFGTASRRLLWEPNLELGVRLGRNVFDKYARNGADIPYYDTRSPYTFFRFHQGNPYEQIFELSYARSLKKHFNAGFAYERFGANKAVAVTNTKTGQVEHSNFLFFVRYDSPEGRYHAMANINTARHRAVEQGGIQPQRVTNNPNAPTDFDEEGNVILPQLFDYQEEVVNLTKATNYEDRDELRLAHTYRLLGRGLTAYHVIDYRRQFNKYIDEAPVSVNGVANFYPLIRRSTVLTDDRAEFRQLENTAGFMGNTRAVEYRLYARLRNAGLETWSRSDQPAQPALKRLQPVDTTQLFVGGAASFQYRQFAVETSGEVRPTAKFSELGSTEYWLRGNARLGPLSGEVLLTSYSPTLTQLRFEGNHYSWDHTQESTDPFENTQVQQVRVRAARQLGIHYLEAMGTVANIQNLVYYTANAANGQFGSPQQLSSARQLTTIMARYRLTWGKFVADNQATYTVGADEDNPGLRIPALVGESRVYYQGYLFKKALLGQLGLQTYFQSRWKAYDYSPSTQQFYVQDHFTLRNTPVVDAFLSADIRTVGIFLKMAYINQFLPQSGYFATPYYAALPRRFQFGIRWQFFN
ncbi:putative porin [Hymenobacter endophyticus]|uniref:Porin n=1 Tax=Hymenobacter endophyticus TaxID=3076335 RepID=A0ABU3TBT8_9BACT|nr:putative porin [Hymenobacter endophyticus]MDU0368829.1 putative porin [Hymenobacter endophyticus]